MDLTKLSEALSTEPRYRLAQAHEAVFVSLIDDWQNAAGLPLALRQKLNVACPLGINAEIFKSRDKHSIKALINFDHGGSAETILLNHADGRHTVCLSCQIGCPLACSFCATGQLGFERNLCADEIVEQAFFWQRYLRGCFGATAHITNVVFMGMGEPFLNYDNVLSAIKVMHAPDKFNLGARRFSISTAGLTRGMEKLAMESLEINLAVSLHAPNNNLRSRLMPVNKQYPLTKLIIALKKYLAKTNRKVMLEYLLIDRLNDSPDLAHELIKLLQILPKHLFFINLIACNKTGVYRPSKKFAREQFKKILGNAHLAVTERYRFGADIAAACGQLKNKKQKSVNKTQNNGA